MIQLLCFSSSAGSTAIHLNVINPAITPNADRMHFVLLTPNDGNIEISLLEPQRLWNHTKFRQDWDIVLLVTGWNSLCNGTNKAMDVIYSAYRERDVNVVVSLCGQFN